MLGLPEKTNMYLMYLLDDTLTFTRDLDMSVKSNLICSNEEWCKMQL